MRNRALPVLLLGVMIAGSGCRSTVGNYFKNRARDLGESFRVQVGAGLGLGASVSAAGGADLGLAVASVPRSAGVGWVYGKGYAFGAGQGADRWESEVDVSLLARQEGPAIDRPLTIVSFENSPLNLAGQLWRLIGIDAHRHHVELIADGEGDGL